MTSSDTAARELAEAATSSMQANDAASGGMGMRVTDVDRDQATIEMPIRDDMLNGLAICHGGFIFSLADTVCAIVSNSRNQKAVLQSATVTMVASAQAGDVLTATGHRRAGEGRVAIIDVEVSNQRGETVALFRGNTYNVRGTHVAETEG